MFHRDDESAALEKGGIVTKASSHARGENTSKGKLKKISRISKGNEMREAAAFMAPDKT